MNQTNQIPLTNRIVGSGLGRYLSLGRKWLWLIVLVTSLGALGGYLFAQTIPPTYRSTITMLIGQLQQNLDPTQTDLQSSTNLASAYALLTQQPKILQETARITGYEGQWQDLYYSIQTTAQPQLLRINVLNPHADSAQALANELAHQLIVQGPISERQAQAQTERQLFKTS